MQEVREEAVPTNRVYRAARGRSTAASVGMVDLPIPVVMGPLAEERAPDPDDGRPLLDGDLEVVAHAHRERRTEVAPPDRCARTGRAGLGTSDEPPRRLDQPPDRSSSPRPRRPSRAARPRGRPASASRREAGLGRVVVDVDLEEDRIGVRRLGRADLAGQPVGPFGQPDRIDGLDGSKASRARRALFDWGGQELPGRARHRRGLGLAFLDAVLAEARQAGGERVAEARGSTVLVTATRVTSAGTGAARTPPRCGSTRARALRRRRCRAARSVGHVARRPASAGAEHLRRRKLGISRSSAS